MFDFFAMVIAIVALIVARKAFNQAAMLQARLDAMAATGFQPRPALPPLEARTEPEHPPITSSPDIAAEQPAMTASAEQAEPAIPDQPAAPDQVAGTTATPPPLPQAQPGFEERIGTRWVVWVGGLTLALGGFFMVRYSIEAGLLGPGVRTLLGGAFALALLAAGEWMRRKESISTIEALPIANIPGDPHRRRNRRRLRDRLCRLCAVRFSRARDRVHPAGAGGARHARRGAAARTGAGGPRRRRRLRHARFWFLPTSRTSGRCTSISPSSPRRRSALARIRLWRWLAVTTIVFALLWTFPCLQCGPSMVGPHVFHVVAGFVLAALLVVCGFLFGPPAEEGRIEPISSGSLAAYLLGATADRARQLPCRRRHDRVRAAGGRHLARGMARAGRDRRGRAPRPCWSSSCSPNGRFAAIRTCWCCRAARCPASGPHATDGSVSLHLTTAAIFAAGFGVAGFLAQGRSVSAIIPVVWSAAAVFTPLALLIALYARIAHLDRSIPFAILAVMLAAAYGAATEILTRRDNRPGLPISIALFATGTLGALALALTFALEKGWLTIALALMSMGTAWISMQRPIPFLRSLAAILAGIVVLRIGYEPRIVGDAVGTTPIFNWLLWGYGMPALSFWVGSIFLRRRGDDAPLRAVESAAILFTVLLVFMEIRHAVNGGDVYRDTAGLTEIALQVCAALAMAIGLERLRIRTGSVIHNVSAVLLTVFAGLASVFGLLLLDNPMLWRIECRRRIHQSCCCSAMRCRRCWRCCCPMRWRAGVRRLCQHHRRRRAGAGAELSDA